MTDSGRKLENHLCILALTGTLFLVIGSLRADAAGCHVTDRPVLARSLSWERWQHGGYTPVDLVLAPAPPAIFPLPCLGETPTLQSFASGLVSADVTPRVHLERLVPEKHAVFESPSHAESPIASRLDRPPRRLSSS